MKESKNVNNNILTSTSFDIIEPKEKHFLNERKNFKLRNILFLTVNASIGYFYFGYNVGVFNTMQENLAFVLTIDEKEKDYYISLISVMIPVGALLGSLFSGKVCNYFGRRRSFIIFDVIAALSSMFLMIPNVISIITFRFIAGFAVGVYSTIVSVYVAEYVPNHLSGMCGLIYNTFNSGGILVSFCLGLALPSDPRTQSDYWKFMFAYPALPCLINLGVLIYCFKLDTPKFLYMEGKLEETKQSLQLIYSSEAQVNEELNQLAISHSDNKNFSYMELLCRKSKYTKRLLLAAALNIFQQTTGVNAISFYSNLIFLEKFTSKEATFYSIMIAVSEVIASIITIFIIERIGRRNLMLYGYGLGCVCLLGMSVTFFFEVSVQKYFVIVFYFICGVSIDPIVWIYNADILPEKGVGISTTVNWLSCVIIIFVFPFMVDSIGLAGSFLIFTLLTFLSVLVIYYNVKETKSKTEAEIDELFK